MDIRFEVQYDSQGREIPDDRRMALPAGWDRPESLNDQIKRLVAAQLSRVAADHGRETFEEADDFDIPDEADEWLSPYTVQEMAPEPLQGADADPPTRGSTHPVKTAPEASKAVPEASDKADGLAAST